jgi:hypothetical protein
MSCDPALEAELVESWARIIRFYEREHHETQWPWLLQLLDLAIALRAAGYDRELRAGQSLHALIVSRSRTHGLDADQAWVAMTADGRRLVLMVGCHQLDAVAFEMPLDGSTDPRLTEMLDALCARPIT